MDAAEIAKIEETYGIALAVQEHVLLETANGCLDPVEAQNKFLLMMALRPLRCPACLGLICQRSAITAGVGVKGMSFRSSTRADVYECPLCHVRLVWHLGLNGDPWFTLHPSSVRAQA